MTISSKQHSNKRKPADDPNLIFLDSACAKLKDVSEWKGYFGWAERYLDPQDIPAYRVPPTARVTGQPDFTLKDKILLRSIELERTPSQVDRGVLSVDINVTEIENTKAASDQYTVDMFYILTFYAKTCPQLITSLTWTSKRGFFFGTVSYAQDVTRTDEGVINVNANILWRGLRRSGLKQYKECLKNPDYIADDLIKNGYFSLDRTNFLDMPLSYQQYANESSFRDIFQFGDWSLGGFFDEYDSLYPTFQLQLKNSLTQPLRYKDFEKGMIYANHLAALIQLTLKRCSFVVAEIQISNQYKTPFLINLQPTQMPEMNAQGIRVWPRPPYYKKFLMLKSGITRWKSYLENIKTITTPHLDVEAFKKRFHLDQLTKFEWEEQRLSVKYADSRVNNKRILFSNHHLHQKLLAPRQWFYMYMNIDDT